ncbi:MAG: PIG-L family deacetylase [Verrucomicrobia bacterium]|nr:PIG-L family deacetylase [Verrucomicrobiota bacterium]
MATPARKTLLAVGAHYDDCVFGIPGILLQAARRNHRVVVLSLIGDYRNWPPARNRGDELKEFCTTLAHYHGIETRFLDFASGRFHLNEESKRAVAQIVAEVRPDIAFTLWHRDRHPDHEAAAGIVQAALRLAPRILDDDSVKVPGQVFAYDNGPGHTIGFEPNTFVDVTDVWTSATEWLGQLMAFVRQKPYDETALDPAVTAKATLARYRGAACGATYAEAVWAMQTRATTIF